MEKICNEIKSLERVRPETMDLAIEFLTRLQPDPLPHCKGSSFGIVLLQWSSEKWGNLVCQISSADNLPSVGVSMSKGDFHSFDFETEEEKKQVLEDVATKLKHLRDDEAKQEVICPIGCGNSGAVCKARNENLANELLDLLGPKYPRPDRTTDIHGAVRLLWPNDSNKVVCYVVSEEGMFTAVELVLVLSGRNPVYLSCEFDTEESKQKTVGVLAKALLELFK